VEIIFYFFLIEKIKNIEIKAGNSSNTEFKLSIKNENKSIYSLTII
jgi:hypothetical protein